MLKSLTSWSQKHFYYLPWRKKRTLFRTLVSEIMLQQTTVGTVLNHFERFMLEYPNVRAIASASEEQLTISWKGLGYYRRARNLKKACEAFVNHYDGNIPLDREKLLKIPGIGDYTAHAILAIGNNEPFLAVDANLERVLSRFYAIDTPKGPKLTKKIYELFSNNEISSEIFKVGGRAYNEALMDLGRNYCKIKNPDCALCPLNKMCKARTLKNVSSFPNVSELKKTKSYNLELLRVIVVQNDKILVYKKESNEWLSGQYEVPTYIISSDDESLSQYETSKLNLEVTKLLPTFKNLITKYKINNKVLLIDKTELKNLNLNIRNPIWVKACQKTQNLSTASIKALKLVGIL